MRLGILGPDATSSAGGMMDEDTARSLVSLAKGVETQLEYLFAATGG